MNELDLEAARAAPLAGILRLKTLDVVVGQRPLVILLVNIAGSGLMGCLAGAIASGTVLPLAWRGFFAIGLLGALTAFSSFALDAGQLWHQCYCHFWHLARISGRLGIVGYGNE